MPTDFLTIDTEFPDGSNRMDAVIDYLEQLRESLRYTLYNLSMENLNDAALGELAKYITAPVYVTVENVAGDVSQLKLTVDGVSSTVMSKVGEDEIISKINQSAEEVSISASKLTLEGIVTANNNFKILADGSMEALNGSFSGEINAESGTFSGVVYFGSGDTGNYIDGSVTSPDSPLINISNNFMVNKSGELRTSGIYMFSNDSSDGNVNLAGIECSASALSFNSIIPVEIKGTSNLAAITIESQSGVTLKGDYAAAKVGHYHDSTFFCGITASEEGVSIQDLAGYGVQIYSVSSTPAQYGWSFTSDHIYLNGVQML